MISKVQKNNQENKILTAFKKVLKLSSKRKKWFHNSLHSSLRYRVKLTIVFKNMVLRSTIAFQPIFRSGPERECLAVVLALKTLRSCLLYEKFTVLTDHNSLH